MRPLVVDVDGTLVRGDLLVESFLAALAARPWPTLRALGALRSGKAALKARLAELTAVRVDLLPLDPAVRTLIEQARADGRRVYLASAANEQQVRGLAAHLGLFDGVFASSRTLNLKGQAKAQALAERFGERGFDYVGNETVDLAVWRHSEQAVIAGGSGVTRRRLQKMRPDATVLPCEKAGFRVWIKAFRPHQWLKNVLIFAAAGAGHSLFQHLGPLLLAFLSFSLCASSVYICNDLLDLPSDREHPRKRQRPFASGRVSPVFGLAAAALSLCAAFGVALLLPLEFLLTLCAYFVLTSAYSMYLKRKPVVDVITLACLYGVRVVAGGYASGVKISQWLEAMSIFLFLSLALIKRCAELVDCANTGNGAPKGRGYKLVDLPALESMAAASGYCAAMVLAQYISSSPDRHLYAQPHRLWWLCILLIAWVSRMLLLTRRGKMNDDPVVFALRDRWSLLLGVACALVLLAASA